MWWAVAAVRQEVAVGRSCWLLLLLEECVMQSWCEAAAAASPPADRCTHPSEAPLLLLLLLGTNPLSCTTMSGAAP